MKEAQGYLGKFLRVTRKDKKLTLRALAARTELTPGYLSRVETDASVKGPSDQTLRVLARALEVSHETLLDLHLRDIRARIQPAIDVNDDRELTEDERLLVSHYRLLTADAQQFVVGIARLAYLLFVKPVAAHLREKGLAGQELFFTILRDVQVGRKDTAMRLKEEAEVLLRSGHRESALRLFIASTA